jgi:hypothetical protein
MTESRITDSILKYDTADASKIMGLKVANIKIGGVRKLSKGIVVQKSCQSMERYENVSGFCSNYQSQPFKQVVTKSTLSLPSASKRVVSYRSKS